MHSPRTKNKLSVTVGITIINAIEQIKANNKYANKSAIANDFLLQGLEARGIQLEAGVN